MVICSYVFNQANNSILTTLNTNITHLAVGTNNTAPTISDTTLGTEVYRDSEFQSIITGFKLVSKIYLDTTEANSNTLEEVGTFTASSGGTMYTRNLVTSFAKTSSKTATYSVKIIFVLQ